LRRSNPWRGEPGGAAGRASRKAGNDRQSESRQGARAHRPAGHPHSCGSDHPMTAKSLHVDLLGGAGGAEISGVDASKPLASDTVAALRRALAEHCVIFLRDQELTPDAQEAVARHFGPLSPTPFIQPLEGHPDMMRIVREAGE